MSEPEIKRCAACGGIGWREARDGEADIPRQELCWKCRGKGLMSPADDRGDAWRAIAEEQSARVRELQATASALAELTVQLRKAIETMGERILELEGQLAAMRREGDS